MAVLTGEIASVFRTAFGGLYLDGTLHRPTTTDDGAGGGSATFADTAVKIQPEATTQAMRDAPGYVDTDKRYFILGYNLDAPNTDCELTTEGKRWLIVNWSRDPAGSYFDVHARFLRNA